jgi:Bacterial aa3 type cytochrome c oxidase subunit IV
MEPTPATHVAAISLAQHRAIVMAIPQQNSAAQDDWAEHERTYRAFVKGVLIFAAHILVVLLVLAWVFSDSLSTPPIT